MSQAKHWIYNTPEKLAEYDRVMAKIKVIFAEYVRRRQAELDALDAAKKALADKDKAERPELVAAINAAWEAHDKVMTELCGGGL